MNEPDQFKPADVFLLFTENEHISEDFSVPENVDPKIKITICYSHELKKMFDILRYLLKHNEYSERGLKLTTLILDEVQNHYAAWIYRKHFINKNGSFIQREIQLCFDWILKEPKGFQSWDHLKYVIDLIDTPDYDKIHQFFEDVLYLDCRNYHCWAFRTWYVKRFSLFKNELIWANGKLYQNLQNNSLWAYRHFLSVEMKLDDQSEVEFAWNILENNDYKIESAWSFFDSFFDKSSEYSIDLYNRLNHLIHNNLTNRFVLKSLIFNEIKKQPNQRDLNLINHWIQELIERYDTKRTSFWKGFVENFIK